MEALRGGAVSYERDTPVQHSCVVELPVFVESTEADHFSLGGQSRLGGHSRLENATPYDPTVGLCPGSWEGPRGVGFFL